MLNRGKIESLRHLEPVARAICEADGVDPDRICYGLGKAIPEGDAVAAWMVRLPHAEAAIKAFTKPATENKIIAGLKEVLSLACDGHGHVRPRKDGVKARCGGPAICSECAKEAVLYGEKQNGQT